MNHLNVLSVVNKQLNVVHVVNVNGIVDGNKIEIEEFFFEIFLFRECQVKHWPKHKPMCEMIVQMSKSDNSQ
jgi:hypothetical protein